MQRKKMANINITAAKSTFKVFLTFTHTQSDKKTAVLLADGKPKTTTLVGTAFLIMNRNKRLFLVTAHHVLRNLKNEHGDKASDCNINLRSQDSMGNWNISSRCLVIRDKDGTDLWVRHPEANLALEDDELDAKSDVAVIPVVEPLLSEIHKGLDEGELSCFPYESLATDKDFEKFGVTIGAELNCFGFPKGIGCDGTGNFPFLRSGKLSSYPVTPLGKVGDLNVDLQLFGGNSGGPVVLQLGSCQKLVGFVRQNLRYKKPTKEELAEGHEIYELRHSKVVPSVLFKEVLDQMPVSDKEKK